MVPYEILLGGTTQKLPLRAIYPLDTFVPLSLLSEAGMRTGNHGFADRCLTDRLACRMKFSLDKDKRTLFVSVYHTGADYGARTRHLRLGKATLYQMS